mgnify:CR=1 FL=1
MRLHMRAFYGPLLALLLLTLLPAAVPVGRAATTVNQTPPNVTVTGRVLLSDNMTPANNTLVWYAPLTSSGSFDYDKQSFIFTSFYTGIFTITLPPGLYGLEIIPPENDSSVRSLRGYTFQVPADSTAPLNLGDIALPRADKQIIGSLQRSGVGLPYVWVYANIPGTSLSRRYTRTDIDGNFRLGVEAASWQVYVDNVRGANWQFVDAPTELSFDANTTPETRTVTFNVPPTVGSIVGRVVLPDGKPFNPATSGKTYSDYVYVSGENSYFGRLEILDATGAFTVPVVADTYTLYTSIDEDFYKIYGPAPTKKVTVTSGPTSVGNLPLELRDSVLNGLVRDSTGAPLPNTLVQAYRAGGTYRSVRTGNDGRFQLKLAAATWELAVLPEQYLGFLESDTTQQVTTSAAAPTDVSFTLTKAANTLVGSFIEEGKPGSPLLDVRGWAYARDPVTEEYVAWDYVNGGAFALNVPAGNLRVGVQLASGSTYSFLAETDVSSANAFAPFTLEAMVQAPFEQQVVVAPNTAGNPAANLNVVLTLGVNNAVITGKLRDTAGNILTNVPVDVSLTPASAGAAWQWADVDESTGTFTLPVRAGTWYLSADVDDDKQPFSVPYSEPVAVTVAAGGTATSDIVLQRLDGVINGKVTDEGTPLPEQLVWVSNDFFSASALTDASGDFSIPVPLTNPDGTAASYTLGSDFSCESLSACFLDIEPIVVTPLAKRATASDELQQNLDLGATKATGGAQLTGSGVSPGTLVKGGEIGDVAKIVKSTAAGDGTFTINISYKKNRSPTELGGNLAVGSAVIRFTNLTVNLAQLAGQLSAAQTGELPKLEGDPFAGLPGGLVAEFDQANGWSATLPDGTRVEIAPSSVPLASADGTRLRISVSPTINIFPTSQYAAANWYGYDIALVAVASNRPISEALLSPARITLRYDARDYLLNNLQEHRLRPAALVEERWDPAESFVANLLVNQVTVQTKRLGTWALVQERPACLSCLYLPSVRR